MSRGVPDAALRLGRDSELGRPAEPSARRTRRETAAALAGVPLFTGVSTKHLRMLADRSEQVVFETGQAVVQEDMLGEAMYVVLAGRALVSRGGRTVGHVMPGEFFGELSAIDGGPRTATVTADTPLSVLRLSRPTLRSAIEAEPTIAVRMLEGMSRRLRQIVSQG